MNNPAKFSDSIINEIFRQLLKFKPDKETSIVLDSFAGSGKLGILKDCFYLYLICNDLEPEWKDDKYQVDEWYHQDAEVLDIGDRKVDFLITSPTYGNRMADHHNAKDNSKRITYTHCLGRKLSEGNTGVMQWGKEYREKHEKIFQHLVQLVKDDGYVFVNVSNHIRKGEEVDVVGWWREMLCGLGLTLVDDVVIDTPRMGFGANGKKRVSGEHLLVLRKKEGISGDATDQETVQ